MTTQHSKLPPSSAARRMACPGSRALEERFGRREASDASNEGTLAHELAAKLISIRAEDIVSMAAQMVEYATLHTVEMREGALFYKDIVHQYLDLHSTLETEQRVEIPGVHSDMWGTVDAWGTRDNELHVFDYKYGFTPVEAYENWQLIAYACGLIDQQEASITDIYLHIVQPRDYVSSSKHKIWYLTSVELEKYRRRLQVSEALSMSPNAPLQVSEQCKYCTARHACPALKQAAFGATEIAFRDIPQGLDASQIGTELKLLHEAQEILEFRVTALETEVQHLLRSGAPVDHYELVPTESRLTWTAEKEDVLGMGKMFGVDLNKSDVITPTQALKAGLTEEAVLKYAERKSGMKLSKVNLQKTKEIFKQH